MDAKPRTDARYTLSPLAQQGASLVILAADGTEEKVRLLDFSRQGLKLEGATSYRTGTALQFRLESQVLGAPRVKFSGQVVQGKHTPLISEELFRKVGERL